MGLVTPEQYNADLLRDQISQGGQTRLRDLRDNYNGQDFERGIVRLVEKGEIALIPVGEHVHVRTE